MSLEFAVNIAAGAFSVVALLIAYYAYLIYKAEQRYKNIPGTKATSILEFFFGDIIKINEAQKKGVIFTQYLADL